MIYNRRKYRNALNLPVTGILPEGYTPAPPPEEKRVWGILDKVFNVADQSVDIYGKLKDGRAAGSDSPSTTVDFGTSEQKIGLFGMPTPWGAVILVTGLSVIGIVVYKKVKK